MTDKNTIIQIFGSLMKTPKLLSQVDKYSITPSDFETRFEKFIFVAIDNLYRNGAERINPVDVSNFLETNASGKVIFEQNNGIEYLQDCEFLSDENNFQYYYTKLKKFNLLRDLQKMGIDTSEFYVEDLTRPRAFDVNKKFEELTIKDVVDATKKKLLKIEKDYIQDSNVQSWDLADEIDDVIDEFGAEENIGLPINGNILSPILNGAELGALTIRSGSSGLGKTRIAVADCAKLAFPFYFDLESQKWVKSGSSEPTLFIMTEQKPDQIIKMFLAYLSGINETKFRFNDLTDEERKRIEIAKKIIKDFNNVKLMRIPDPSIEQLKLAVREEVIMSQRKYVFFDYIFVSPALLEEFRGHGLRNDECLLLMATALKDLAIEQNVSIFTSTQVNARADDNTEIRNESSLAGGRSTINKADNGMIMARPTKDEIDILTKDGTLSGVTIPNIVIDIFKVRSGNWNQVRVWRYFDLGTLRIKDLFVTDSRLMPIQNLNLYSYDWEITKEEEEYLNKINKKG